MGWQDIAALASNIFWPKLLHGETLERFCAQYLPETFADLQIPFAVIATELPANCALVITEGNLASAISASCALRGVRRPVRRAGKRLKDGGITCVLPSMACRLLGAEFIVGADVWEVSSLLHKIGITPNHPWASRTYPSHYRIALQSTDLLIQPHVPWSGYLSGPVALERMISAGELATKRALDRLSAKAA
jgi:NTE family protein